MASLTIHEKDKEPRTVPLDKLPLVIGRSSKKSQLTFDFLGISGAHCQIVDAGETLKIVDLNSANHTFVNGRMIAEHFLNHGDRIALGLVVMIFNNDKQKQPPPSESKAQSAPVMIDGVSIMSEPTFFMEGAKLNKNLQIVRSGKIEAVTEDVEPLPQPAPKVVQPPSPAKPPIAANARDYANAMNKASAPPKKSSSCSIIIFILIFICILSLAAIAYLLIAFRKQLGF